MTRRTFKRDKYRRSLVHWHAGGKKAEVARSLGVDRGTVAEYTAKAEAEGYAPGGEAALSREQWASARQRMVPRAGRSPAAQPHPRRDRCPSEPHRRDAQDQHRHDGAPATARRARLQRWPHQLPPLRVARVPRGQPGATSPPHHVLGSPPAKRHRSTTATSGTWLDPITERLRRARAFVMVLACILFMFLRPVLIMDQRGLDLMPYRGVRILRCRVPRRLVSRQFEDRGHQARYRRPAPQPLLRRAGRPLRLSHRPGSGPQAEG